MSWYKGEGSPRKYDDHFNQWLPHTQRQVKHPWPYKVLMAKKTKGLVLDAGCGIGVLCRFIENGVFLDFSHVGLKKRWVGGSRPRVLGSVEDLPFRNAVFDSVISSDVIEHTDNPKRFVAEVYRILKKDGFFTFSSPWADPSPAHKFKHISKEMVDDWINPPFQDYTIAESQKEIKGRFMVYAYKLF